MITADNSCGHGSDTTCIDSCSCNNLDTPVPLNPQVEYVIAATKFRKGEFPTGTKLSDVFSGIMQRQLSRGVRGYDEINRRASSIFLPKP